MFFSVHRSDMIGLNLVETQTNVTSFRVNCVENELGFASRMTQ